MHNSLRYPTHIKRATERSNLKISVNHIIYLLNIVKILIRVLNLIRTNTLVRCKRIIALVHIKFNTRTNNTV